MLGGPSHSFQKNRLLGTFRLDDNEPPLRLRPIWQRIEEASLIARIAIGGARPLTISTTNRSGRNQETRSAASTDSRCHTTNASRSSRAGWVLSFMPNQAVLDYTGFSIDDDVMKSDFSRSRLSSAKMSSDCASNDSKRWCEASRLKMSKGREGKTGRTDGFSFVINPCETGAVVRSVGTRAEPISMTLNALKPASAT